ncbi:HAD family hydrolase [Novosphingobium sp. JCM 18896]|uniref:HAD family hydrolase n=1 Tax=Novosphingobium sp. JCM 18896 TaxID=2989731 RepID=UPI002222D0D5|nr:HAD-IA family hydrolase [Novosphingobium sp. JCM 18896]MCW1431586.1 HAD-IA family hydrolase [Novosphingobium sp. JCM 18896]
MSIEALIFDFDGVIADSEHIANVVVSELSTQLGYSVCPEDALDIFVGKRSSEVRDIIEQETGQALPGFETTLLSRTLEAFARGLEPVKGAAAYLERHSGTPKCIASSSSHARLEASLAKIGLREHFAGRVFSADDVARGKPFPDLFLHAANQLAVLPSRVLVIEDSVSGVKAAKAAGMSVVGLLAGSHVRPNLAERLAAAGADFLVADYEELDRVVVL